MAKNKELDHDVKFEIKEPQPDLRTQYSSGTTKDLDHDLKHLMRKIRKVLLSGKKVTVLVSEADDYL